MKVYIPSYLGKGEKLIAKRLKKHNEQIDWLLSSNQVEMIVICSQNYPENAKRNDVRIHYIDSEAKGPSYARNVLLRHHYASGDDACIFIDNDISSEVHTIDEIIDLANRVNSASEWNLLGFVPHGFGLKRTPPEILTFKRKTVFATGLFFMKGIKKLFFDEALQSLEDVDFALRAMIEYSYSYYEIEEYEFYDHTYAASVIYEEVDRKAEYDKLRGELREKYGTIVKGKGWTSLQNFINTFPRPKEVKISLKEEYSAKKLF
jgi:hypothetical protein